MQQASRTKLRAPSENLPTPIYAKPGEKTDVAVRLVKNTRTGAFHIEAPINGLIACMPAEVSKESELAIRRGSSAAPIQQEIGTHAQQPIELSLADMFMDYDTTGQIYANRRFAGATTRKEYMIAKLGIFTPMSDVKQIVWKFPIISNDDIDSWDFLPDWKQWPVIVSPPPGTLYPSDFGYGMAIRWNPAHRVYLVTKHPLDQSQFTIEKPKYYGAVFQVPEWMIHFRYYGVLSINVATSPNVITFARRGQNNLMTTINEVRKISMVDIEYQKRIVAMCDILNDYPQQLANLLNPGEVEQSKRLRDILAAQNADTSVADNSSSTTSLSNAPSAAEVPQQEPPSGSSANQEPAKEPAEASEPAAAATPTATNEASETTPAATKSIQAPIGAVWPMTFMQSKRNIV